MDRRHIHGFVSCDKSNEVRGFDAADQMDLYCDWYEGGYLSSTGECFDIGDTTRRALILHQTTKNPFSGSADPMSAGNGSLMRLAAVPMFYYPDRDRVLYFSGESSRTTHGAPECIDACRLFGDMLRRALSGASKQEILFGGGPDLVASAAIKAIALGECSVKNVDDIQGTGYVVKSLEAALCCFLNTETFRDAILKAVNLGDDADTTAVICGQISGAFYGESGIPLDWLERLAMREKISQLAEQIRLSSPNIG